MEQSQIELTIEEIRGALESGNVLDAIAALIQLRPADRAEAFSSKGNRTSIDSSQPGCPHNS